MASKHSHIEAFHIVQLVGLHSCFSDQTSHKILTFLNLFHVGYVFCSKICDAMLGMSELSQRSSHLSTLECRNHTKLQQKSYWGSADELLWQQ
ncbi:hypothetical protein AAZX31_15G212500 [Glycine max]